MNYSRFINTTTILLSTRRPQVEALGQSPLFSPMVQFIDQSIRDEHRKPMPSREERKMILHASSRQGDAKLQMHNRCSPSLHSNVMS
ncbi:hypothetical protein PILCRDRAFT_825455 [Piloderma croceum F 1598]|uniref:Uncharacterized protein n=1 Tax=Piloderma croceum (strain F 1598) TaxID=765440 RepID=A0A0C3BIV6_PILCF|nr:hypothetical protein PILCRDRAFT_825455 [Piloderma croceum F 1598]